MERIRFVRRARLDTRASEASGASRQPLSDATQIGVDLQEMRSGLLHELPILSEVFHCARRHRGSRTGARHDDRQKSTNDAGEGKKPSQLEQARTALLNAKSAVTSRGDRQSGTRGGKASVADSRSPPDRSCEGETGKSPQGRRTTEGTLARARGASQGRHRSRQRGQQDKSHRE